MYWSKDLLHCSSMLQTGGLCQAAYLLTLCNLHGSLLFEEEKKKCSCIIELLAKRTLKATEK